MAPDDRKLRRARSASNDHAVDAADHRDTSRTLLERLVGSNWAVRRWPWDLELPSSLFVRPPPPADRPLTDQEKLEGLNRIANWSHDAIDYVLGVRAGRIERNELVSARLDGAIRAMNEAHDGIRAAKRQHRAADVRFLVIERVLESCALSGEIDPALRADAPRLVVDDAIGFAEQLDGALHRRLEAGRAKAEDAVQKLPSRRRECIFELENLLNGSNKASTVDARRAAERRFDKWRHDRAK